MRIGIDIDGVLTNIEQFLLDYLSKWCVLNHISFTIDCNHLQYDEYQTFGITKEQGDAFWREYLEFYAMYEKPRPFAKDVIQKLKDDGYEIYIITARLFTNQVGALGEKMREIVKKWLDENEIYYDKLIFSKASKERKVDEILQHHIDLMVEDNPNNIKEISKYIPVICYDATYNRECSGKNITRCYSFYDIYRMIKEEDYNGTKC